MDTYFKSSWQLLKDLAIFPHKIQTGKVTEDIAKSLGIYSADQIWNIYESVVWTHKGSDSDGSRFHLYRCKNATCRMSLEWLFQAIDCGFIKIV